MFLLHLFLMRTFLFSLHQHLNIQNAYPEPVLNPWTTAPKRWGGVMQPLVYTTKWGACPQGLQNALAACSYTAKHRNRTGLDCWISHLTFSWDGPWFHYWFSFCFCYMFCLCVPLSSPCINLWKFRMHTRNLSWTPEPPPQNGGGVMQPLVYTTKWGACPQCLQNA